LNHVLHGVQWRHLANTIEPSMCGGDAAFLSNYTSITCYYGRAGTLYIHFWGFCPLTEFCQVQNSLCVQVSLSYVGSVTARHSSSGRQRNFAALSRGCHLYSVGRPSHWASAHIIVIIVISYQVCCAAAVNSTDNDEIQFTLKKAGDKRHRRRHLEVTTATVNVLLGPRVTSHSRRSLGNVPFPWNCHYRAKLNVL